MPSTAKPPASPASAPRSSTREPRPIKLIVVHCSASPNGRRVTSEEIDRWHAQRGFSRNPALIGYNAPRLKHIGYHYVIYANGPVTTGRVEQEPGAHVTGFNAHSISICMVGTDHFREAQWQALASLIRGLQLRYPNARVVGHRDLSPDQNKNGIVEKWEWLKTCPGFDVASWIKGGMAPMEDHLLEAPPK